MNAGEKDNTILTLYEIAQYLKVSKRTIFRLIEEEKISGFKVGNQWRFLKSVINDWAMSKMQSLPEENIVSVITTAKKNIPLSQLVTKDRIILDITPGNKKEVLSQLIVPLYLERLIKNPDEYLKKLSEREQMISTALCNGVAFPHISRTNGNPAKENFLVLGICKEGTDFESVDGKNTYVFALFSAVDENVHLHILAKLTLFFRIPDIVKTLLSAHDKETVLQVLRDADNELTLKF